jgi:hypothetical protein
MSNAIMMRFSATLSHKFSGTCKTAGMFNYNLEDHVCSVTYDSPSFGIPDRWSHGAGNDADRISSREDFDVLRASGDLESRIDLWATRNGHHCSIDGWAEPGLTEGQYRPMMWRPGGPDPHEADIQAVLTDAMVAYRGLESSILEVFQVIHPTAENMKVYGHRIRELLILCCTEVEHLLAEAAKANGLVAERHHYEMRDYGKLAEPLWLGEWGVKLRDYPTYPDVLPFKGWPQVTQRLSWYQSYNKVKHHRRDNFDKASLENLLLAAGGLVILLAAEFGEGRSASRSGDGQRLFKIARVPVWPLQDRYTKPTSGDWLPVPFFRDDTQG